MLVETSKRAHVANPAAAQLPRSPKTRAFEGVVMYYGYRFYDPETGRWPSRDPIVENGGVNLYGFVRNDGIRKFDVLGLWGWNSSNGGVLDAAWDWTRDTVKTVGSLVVDNTLIGQSLDPIGSLERNVARLRGGLHLAAAAVPGASITNRLVESTTGHEVIPGQIEAERQIFNGFTGGCNGDKSLTYRLTYTTINVASFFVGAGEVKVVTLIRAETQVLRATTVIKTESKLLLVEAKAVKGVDTGMPHMPGYLPDSAPVLRGGQNLPESFLNGSGVSLGEDGLLDGVSVNSSGYGQTLAEISNGIPHNSVGSTTVGEIRALGGDVIPRPTPKNPLHAILSGVDADTASELMMPLIKNPAKTQ